MSSEEKSFIMAKAESDLRDLLHRILLKHNYLNPEIKIKPISTEGANYMAALFLATITNPQQPTLNLFNKVSILSDQVRDSIDATTLFDIEAVFYEEITKAFEDFQNKHNVPINKRIVFPKFYGCNKEMKREILILENMKASKYEDPDRFKSVNWEHAAASIETLARFHALSFAYNKENPEEFAHYAKKLKVPENKDKPSMVQKLYDFYLSHLNGEMRERIERVFDEDIQSLFFKYNFDVGVQSVLVHSDFKPNNLMFKKLGTKLHAVPVDFQTVHLGCPVTDLVYFITLGTDGAFRQKYHHQLLHHYYQELSAAMKRLGVDAAEVYPRKQFDNEWDDMLPYALLLSLTLLPLIVADPDAAPKTDGQSDSSNFCLKPNKKYVQRFEELFEDLERWGVV